MSKLEEAKQNLNEIIKLVEPEINKNDENVTAILDLKDLKSLSIVLEELNNSIPKHIIQDILKQIRKNEQLAGECIEQTIIIADSDSLNYGRAEAHNCDANILEELLEGK